jgi:hypothetical protein
MVKNRLMLLDFDGALSGDKVQDVLGRIATKCVEWDGKFDHFSPVSGQDHTPGCASADHGAWCVWGRWQLQPCVPCQLLFFVPGGRVVDAALTSQRMVWGGGSGLIAHVCAFACKVTE